MHRNIVVSILGLACANGALAQSVDNLAKQLQNPIASLTSVPLQFNYEREAGLDGEGERVRLNVQPVIPKDLGERPTADCSTTSSRSAATPIATT